MIQQILTQDKYEEFKQFAVKNGWQLLKRLDTGKVFEIWVAPNGESYKIGIGG
jgi:hypothetical protein